MANRTQQRPPASGRFARSTTTTRSPRTGTPSTSAGRRTGRPTPGRKPTSSSPLNRLPFGGSSSKKGSSGKGLAGLAGALGGGAKKASGGGVGKGAGGLAAVAGLAGLALKNRSKITGKLGRGKQSEPEVIAPATPVTTTTTDNGPTV
jgi:hypothetical protein